MENLTNFEKNFIKISLIFILMYTFYKGILMSPIVAKFLNTQAEDSLFSGIMLGLFILFIASINKIFRL